MSTPLQFNVFLSIALFNILVSLRLVPSLSFPFLSREGLVYLLTSSTFSLLIAIPALFFKRTWPYLIAIFLFTLFNTEHIIINNSHLDPIFSHLAFSQSFLKSLGNLSILKNFFFLITLLSFSWLMVHKLKLTAKKLLIVEGILYLVFIDFFFPRNISLASWQQSNFIRSYIQNHSHESSLNYNSPKLEKTSLPAPLPSIEKKPNIYIIILEGFSERYSEIGLTPQLIKIQKESIHYENFLSNQAQTNRGLYSLLCGEYPNLHNKEAKSDILISSTKLRENTNCIPEVLKEYGYTNFFLQSAPLSFMGKDRFAKAVGFDFAIGAEQQPTNKILSSWGVDDETTFDSLVDLSKEKNSPFLITALTVSTHYPYKTKVSSGSLNKAIAYTDKLTGKLFRKIKENDPDAIIIITSDESRSLTSKDNLFQANRALLMIHQEATTPYQDKNYYSQVDLKNILLYHLGLKKDKRETKPIYFANVYSSKIHMLDHLNQLTVCDLSFNCFKTKPIKSLNAPLRNLKKIDAKEAFKIKEFVQNNDLTFSNTIYHQEDIFLGPNKSKSIISEFKINAGTGQDHRGKLILDIGQQDNIEILLGTYICGKAETHKKRRLVIPKGSSTITLPKLDRSGTTCLTIVLKNPDQFKKTFDVTLRRSQ